MKETKEFQKWLEGQYIYSSDIFTGEIKVGEIAYYKNPEGKIKKISITANTPEREEWKAEKLIEFNTEYKALVEETKAKKEAKKINTRTMMGLLKRHSQNKGKYDIYNESEEIKNYYNKKNKTLCIFNKETEVLFALDCEKLFSERNATMTYCTKSFYDENEMTIVYEEISFTGKNYVREFEIFFPEDVDKIFEAIKTFESNFVTDNHEEIINRVKGNKTTYETLFNSNKYLIKQSQQILEEKYKNNPEKILKDLISPGILEVYHKLKK